MIRYDLFIKMEIYFVVCERMNVLEFNHQKSLANSGKKLEKIERF